MLSSNALEAGPAPLCDQNRIRSWEAKLESVLQFCGLLKMIAGAFKLWRCLSQV